MNNLKITHLNDKNQPKIVDISHKAPSKREAVASGVIYVSKEAYEAVKNQTTKKGAVLQTAVIAAIMGAKKTHDLIPMCHPLLIQSIDVDIEQNKTNYSFKLYVCIKVEGKTGVEMEALTAVSIGLLTIYDMLKAIDKSMIIGQIQLESKSGGKSGDFKREQ